jgi:PAS domain S-box-containing protein
MTFRPTIETMPTIPTTERKVRALIVEDSPTQSKLLSISLSRLGVDGECVGRLSDAFERLKTPGIDVVLLDLSLPDSHGIETFYRMHERYAHIPVVVLTGLDDQKIALEAVKGGAQEYLVKGRANDDSVVRCLRYAIERNHAETALRESERRMRLIVENSLDAFLAMDKNGRLIDWNKHAEMMFGYSREEALGKNVNELIAWSFRKNRAPIDFDQLLAEQGEKLLDKRIGMMAIRREGKQFPVELGLFRVEDPKGDIYCTFINDITERKEIDRRRRALNRELESKVQERTQDLQRSNEELQQFAKIASHDLQEPLRAVQGFANLLAERYQKQLDKNGAEFIDFILDGTMRMQKLIQSVLEHSSIQTTDQEVPITNTNSALREVLVNLNTSILENDAEIVFDDKLPPIRMNRTHVIQLFQNIISNALKYRGETPPRIEIAAELNVNEWLFSIRDNGIGVEQRFAEKIFDMFARLHGRGQYAGTGMGLAICKKIVTANGGRIWMESEPGHGSIFFFTLPDVTKTKEEINAR